jgi:uncharacterized protein
VEIRSITFGGNLTRADDEATLHGIGRFLQGARTAFTQTGFVVQTVRLGTQPFPRWLTPTPPAQRIDAILALEETCHQERIDYCSIGPVGLDEADTSSSLTDGWLEWIPELLARTESIFATAVIATRRDGINLAGLGRVAVAIKRIADTTNLGFGNLRFATLANCPADSPFFPVSYHEGDQPSFAVATEAADVAIAAFTAAGSLAEARANLVSAVEEAAGRLAAVGAELERASGIRFGGIDFSLAPYPTLERSIGTAFERLGGARFGQHGTLFAAALMTEALERARFPRCGFSGLMLPVLEDATLALCSTGELYTLDSLLLYSAVCGTGLDTVPLPGDVEPAELAAILLDMATLALRLNKPLTARLMPIPGGKAGDLTTFDFSYFANARILQARGGAGSRVWSRDTRIDLQPLHWKRGYLGG